MSSTRLLYLANRPLEKECRVALQHVFHRISSENLSIILSRKNDFSAFSAILINSAEGLLDPLELTLNLREVGFRNPVIVMKSIVTDRTRKELSVLATLPDVHLVKPTPNALSKLLSQQSLKVKS